jgi:fused signal recognition particle receptor
MFAWFRKKEKEDEKEMEGFLGRLKQGLSKTRAGFTGRLDQVLFGKKEISGEFLEDLEEVLFTSDLGVATTQELIQKVQESMARRDLDRPDKLREVLKQQIRTFLDVPEVEHREPAPGEPLVVVMVGVNGVGKTTAIGKTAYLFKEEGKSVMLVAGDTFRAAAVEQLQIWAERVGAEVVKQKEGSDPSAVVYDALSAAASRKTDVVLIDTAGRLHTKTNLMDELEKICRIAGKKLPGSPHEVWLVLDATTGQNAIAQAETFNKALRVTGIILTKLDGTAKGGIVVGICHQLKIPIRFIGIGEKLDDLRPFDASEFVEAIFG